MATRAAWFNGNNQNTEIMGHVDRRNHVEILYKLISGFKKKLLQILCFRLVCKMCSNHIILVFNVRGHWVGK